MDATLYLFLYEVYTTEELEQDRIPVVQYYWVSGTTAKDARQFLYKYLIKHKVHQFKLFTHPVDWCIASIMKVYEKHTVIKGKSYGR